mmetsp:Transcript_75968/g.131596  ORF Transcript_75968/g.131596 Transcript_75968/m.131596 type:complete len:272 (-) Transcript_75968:141-956(-)
MSRPSMLRLRGTFIDLAPNQSEIESGILRGSRVRSLSSPPGMRLVEEPAENFEHCSNEYLKGLVSRVMKLSSSTQSPGKEDSRCPQSAQPAQCRQPHLTKENDMVPQQQAGCNIPLESSALPKKCPASKGSGKFGDALQYRVPSQVGAITTLMIRNVPCKITLNVMIDLLDSYGFRGTYDFLHLPGRGAPFSNLGYAFINFMESDTVHSFVATFQGVAFGKITGINTEKVIEIRPARAQGFEENLAKVHHIMSNGDNSSLFVRTQGASYLL